MSAEWPLPPARQRSGVKAEPSAANGMPLGCVLAGGASSRMGRDKATLLYRGEPLVAHAVRCLREVGCQPFIAGARVAGLERFAPVLADRYPGCGPLAGIESGLAAAVPSPAVRARTWTGACPAERSDGSTLEPAQHSGQLPQNSCLQAVLFLPVDLPLLPAGFLRLLLDRALLTGALATVPLLGGRPQPLCAVYHPALLPGIRAALEGGDYKVMRVIEALTRDRDRDVFPLEAVLAASSGSAAVLAASSVPGAALLPAHRWFANVNTPADLAALPV